MSGLRRSGLYSRRAATQFVEPCKYRRELLAFTRILIDLLQAVHQFRVFGANFTDERISLLIQRVCRFGVVLFIGRSYLIVELFRIAVGLQFRLIAGDNLSDLLCLSLCRLWGIRGRATLLAEDRSDQKSENGDSK